MMISRRTFLRSTGVAIALPLLDVMKPQPARGRAPAAALKRRMVCINTPLGVHPEYFFPDTPGGISRFRRTSRCSRNFARTLR
jgi:hypothetical protein